MTAHYHPTVGFVQTDIMLPTHDPTSVSDRSAVGNSVELDAKAENAQLAIAI